MILGYFGIGISIHYIKFVYLKRMAINQGDQISQINYISVRVAFSVEFDSRKTQDGKEERPGGVGIINWSTVYHDSD